MAKLKHTNTIIVRKIKNKLPLEQATTWIKHKSYSITLATIEETERTTKEQV
jgi:hypothetical protein